MGTRVPRCEEGPGLLAPGWGALNAATATSSSSGMPKSPANSRGVPRGCAPPVAGWGAGTSSTMKRGLQAGGTVLERRRLVPRAPTPQLRRQPWSCVLERRRWTSEAEACPAGERRRALPVGSPTLLGRRCPSPGPGAFRWKRLLKKVSMAGPGGRLLGRDREHQELGQPMAHPAPRSPVTASAL